MTNILFIGDIVGRPGRRAVREILPALRAETDADCVIANAENAAGGSGVTPEIVGELLGYGIHILTSGDHIWRNKEVHKIIGRDERLLRPANFPPEAPGKGGAVVKCGNDIKVGVINVLGRVFLGPVDCPFRAAQRELEAVAREAVLILVDFHAEATSEKIAMGRYLDGKVTAVVGTHTHVQTADEQIFPGGSAFITDAGMTGPAESILGREIKPVIANFLTRMPQRFNVAKGDIEFQGVLITADESSGKAVEIRRVRRRLNRI